MEGQNANIWYCCLSGKPAARPKKGAWKLCYYLLVGLFVRQIKDKWITQFLFCSIMRIKYWRAHFHGYDGYWRIHYDISYEYARWRTSWQVCINALFKSPIISWSEQSFILWICLGYAMLRVKKKENFLLYTTSLY